MNSLFRLLPAAWGLLLLLQAPLSAQSFVDNQADIPSGAPSNASASQSVDFADIDLDGDWDVGFADGGDLGNDQNRLWINQGGLQGGTTGVFTDETASRFPALSDGSFDLDFVDLDGDGDPDIFVTNHSEISNQPSRFWMNVGVGSGFFVDETSTRWIGLGDPGSSLWPAQV